MRQYVNDFNSFVINEASKSYESYLQKNYRVEIINALIESKTLNTETQFILESISENNLYNDLWDGNISEQFINENLNEGTLADWFQEKKEKAKEKIQDIVSAGAEKMTAAKKAIIDGAKKTMEVFKSFGDWVGKILNAVKVGLQKLWKAVYGHIEKKFNGKESEVVAGAAGKMKKDPEASKNEVKNLGQMTAGGVKWVTGGAVEKIGAAIKDAGKKNLDESESVQSFYDVIIHEATLICVSKYGMNFINELSESELILEGGDSETVKIPGLSKLTHAMHELPIIKQLGDIEHAAAKATNSGLGALSYTLNKLGAAGGPYKFAIIGGIIGLGVEYLAKAKVKSALGLESEDIEKTPDVNEEDIFEGEGKTLKQYLITAGISGAILAICIMIPGFGVVFGIMKKVATFLWWYSVIQAALKLLDQMTGGKISKASDDLGDKISGIFKDTKKETDEETEKNIEKAKEDAEEDIKKGGEGHDDEDDKDKDKDKDKK